MSPQNQQRPEHYGSAGADPQSSGHHKKSRRLSNLISELHRILRERRAKKNQEGAADRAARKTATATVFIAIFTFATVAVGVSQFFVFKWQLGEMQRAGKQTDHVVAAMQGQLEQMKASSKQTDRIIATMEGQLAETKNRSDEMRSLIQANLKRDQFVVKVAQRDNKIIAWEVNPMWKNVGGTDARDVYSWWNIRLFEPDMPPDFDSARLPVADTHPTSTSTIGPGGGFFQEAGYLSLADAQKAEVTGKIYAWGYVEYRDIFSETMHHRRWVVWVVPNDISQSKFSFINKRDQSD
jgi:hypothetical protein